MLRVSAQSDNIKMDNGEAGDRWGLGDSPDCARDFITERLSEADSPLSPSEMAEEYGCSNGHVRNILQDLLDEGVVKRPRRGKYVLADGGGAEMDSEAAADDLADSEGNDTSDGGPEYGAVAEEDHAGGEARSEGPDTSDGDNEGIDPATALLVATALFAGIVLVDALLSDGSDDGDGDEEIVDLDPDESDEPEVTLIE